MWDLPRPGLKPMSPALAGGFLTTVPPGKSQIRSFLIYSFIICIRVLQRNRTNKIMCVHSRVCVCVCVGWEAPRSSPGRLETRESYWCSSSLSPRPENSVNPWCKFQSENQQIWDPRSVNASDWVQKPEKTKVLLNPSGRRYSLFLSLFVLFRSSVGWMRPTYIREGHLLYNCTDLNVNLIRTLPHRHTQNNVWPKVWEPCGPVKLTHKIPHHYPHLAPQVLWLLPGDTSIR